jgi:hypothetical protein
MMGIASLHPSYALLAKSHGALLLAHESISKTKVTVVCRAEWLYGSTLIPQGLAFGSSSSEVRS